MDKLAYRLEYKDQGPFRDSFNFLELQKKIITGGGSVDKFGTTFLNVYDQNTAAEMVFKRPFKSVLDEYALDLRFGFVSKESMIENFGIWEDEDYGNKYQEQFEVALSMIRDLNVKVYLVEPLLVHKDEVAFLANGAKLVEIATSYKSFLSL